MGISRSYGKKPNGSWRVKGDYRRLNQVTVMDYSIPFLHDCTENISGSIIFSSIDLFKSYHQIHFHPKHIAKTAICTPAEIFKDVYGPN